MNPKDKTPRSHRSDAAGGASKDGSAGSTHEKKAPPSIQVAGEGEPERIAKLLARAGVASRREAERMIVAGRVSVNGKKLETPAFTATLADEIVVDGQPIRGIERTRMWLYYKPAGLVTTNNDPEGRPTVFDKLPKELPRVLTIGRLDINTEGLLLLTNDGGLSRVLELPSTGWLRRYRVRAHGRIDQERLDKLKDGIAVDGVLYGAIEATLDRTQGSNNWITMGLREGKNREIKNVLGALGLEVNRLIRISYGPFQLGDLAEGQVLEVRGKLLRDQLGDRLTAEAGANFDAPLFDEDKKQKKSGWEKQEQGTDGGRDRKPRKLDPLDRLSTKREADDRKSGDGKSDKSGAGAKKRPGPRSRASNVWMAPGARPDGPKQAAAKAAKKATRSADPSRKTGKPSSGKPGQKERSTPKHSDTRGRSNADRRR